MAKGKKAAQAASRRATEASSTVAELSRALSAERDSKRQLETTLRDEIRALRSSLDSEVEARSNDRIAAIERRAEAEIAAAAAQHAEASSQVVRLLHDADPAISLDIEIAVARLLNVNLAKAFAADLAARPGRSGRKWRRAAAHTDRETMHNIISGATSLG